MSLWAQAGVVAGSGAVGGLLAAWTTGNRIPLPRREDLGGIRFLRLGALAFVGTGAVSSAVSWVLYGPFPQLIGLGFHDPRPSSPYSPVGEVQVPALTIAALCGAFLVGLAGARLLAVARENALLRIVAYKLAGGASKPGTGDRILRASQQQLVDAARNA